MAYKNSINKHNDCGCGSSPECVSILDIASPIEGQILKYAESFNAFINVSPEDFTQINSDWNAIDGVSKILNKPLILDEFVAVNGTSSIIPKGSVVYINGSNGTNLSVNLASSLAYNTSNVIGITNEDLVVGGSGIVKSKGFISLNLSSFNLGDTLYLSETNGAFTNIRPVSNGVQVGFVVANTTTGSLLVSIKKLLPNIIVSTSDPSGIPNNGDIWLKVAN